ncbi:hypothetical protein [Saccharomonospora sp. CUA-673]|nr:hypothetical protein [Saccharomonospora sp. CUA-673]
MNTDFPPPFSNTNNVASEGRRISWLGDGINAPAAMGGPPPDRSSRTSS